jgi:hypothetical protein
MVKRKLKDLSSPEKNELGDKIVSGETSYTKVLLQYDGGRRTLEKWVSKRKEGIRIHSRDGNPGKLDMEIEKSLFQQPSKKG